jgi:hypothetical protein
MEAALLLTRVLTGATPAAFMTLAKMSAASASWLLITWAYTRRVIESAPLISRPDNYAGIRLVHRWIADPVPHINDAFYMLQCVN